MTQKAKPPPPVSLLRDSELPNLVSVATAPETRRGRRLALRVLVLVSFLAAAYVASPLWVGIAFGTVMAFATQRPYRALSARIGGRRGSHVMAAGLLTLVTGLCCLGAGLMAIYVISGELVTTVAYLQAHGNAASLSEIIGPRGARLVVKLGVDPTAAVLMIHRELDGAMSSATTAAGSILATTSTAVLELILSLITMYYVLIDWPRIATRLERVLPLDPRHTRSLILEMREVGRSAFIGTIATALIQGALAAAGYTVLGIPRAATWGLLTALCSLIPVIGTAVVWAPAAGYLAMTGNPGSALLLVAWCVLVVTSLADYVIRPRIVGAGGHGHPLLMLIAILGGIEVFGIAGLVVGPIIVSLFVAALRIYETVEVVDDEPLPVTALVAAGVTDATAATAALREGAAAVAPQRERSANGDRT